jgi:predicted MFS family arabinose efflux permease
MLIENSVTYIDADRPAAWTAVLALSLGPFALVASEFMPVSLLTPIAADLHVTEGQAGQAISVSGAFAVLTSLFMTAVVGNLDRKLLLLALTGLVVISGTIVAIAPDYPIFMVGRALIGIAIGGFWTISAATAMRLVPDCQVPKALAILNGGNALATVVAAPLGSFLGGVIGWRGAFFCVVPVAVVVFLWQLASLPRMRSHAKRPPQNVFRLLAKPVVSAGMAGAGLFFMGQFALFTYLRPYLEAVVKAELPSLSLLLLIMGVAGFIGTAVSSFVLKHSLYRTLVVIPVLMAIIALTLVALEGALVMSAVLLAAWGLLATSAPVGWWTWLAKTIPDDAEAGGGLMVAVVQLAITLGAVLGGLAYDASGYRLTFAVAAIVLVLAAAMAEYTRRLS